VVLVDFWTYTCINCIRTLPYLNAWYAKYHRAGFEIVGVHTPEFPFEHSASNVAAAIAQDGIHYPVVQDNNYGTWNAYGNEYWPAEYFIDAQGRVRLADFGEGEYGAKQRAIRALLEEAGAPAPALGGTAQVHAQAPSEAEITPESYLGANRAQRFTNGSITPGTHNYGATLVPPALSNLSYAGLWSIGAWNATAVREARLELRFTARRVFLVMGSPTPRAVRVLLDGRPIPRALAGADVRGGSARVSRDRLYRLVELPGVQTHNLTVQLPPGVSAYDFSFG